VKESKGRLIEQIDVLLSSSESVTIAIDGMSGAGKSTLAAGLAVRYDDCGIIHIDDYYDCSVGRLKEEEIVERFGIVASEHRLVVVEGVYCLKFDFAYDLKLFMEIPEAEQHRRIKARNPDLYDKYINKWIPAENEYFHNIKEKEKESLIYLEQN